MRILRKSIWRLYAGRSLVQRLYVMHMQFMSFCIDSPHCPTTLCHTYAILCISCAIVLSETSQHKHLSSLALNK